MRMRKREGARIRKCACKGGTEVIYSGAAECAVCGVGLCERRQAQGLCLIAA